VGHTPADNHSLLRLLAAATKRPLMDFRPLVISKGFHHRLHDARFDAVVRWRQNVFEANTPPRKLIRECCQLPHPARNAIQGVCDQNIELSFPCHLPDAVQLWPVERFARVLLIELCDRMVAFLFDVIPNSAQLRW
jgi:hypothetical protein